MENDKELLALDLIIEDLNIKNLSVRNTAKELNCEKELDIWKDRLLAYMYESRKRLKLTATYK